MFKQVKIIILPSKERARKGDLTFFGDKLVIASSILHLAQVSQHLYILSDEEIKEGDWYYQHNSYGSIIDKCDNKSPFLAKSARYIWENGGKKIITTTDKSLKIIKSVTNPALAQYIISGDVNSTYEDILPQPSQSFIEYFVEEYNKGNVITDVMVEYEGYKVNGMIDEATSYRPKINPKDNTINIRKVKDNYNREEIEYLLHLIVNESHCGFERVKHPNSNECVGFVNKWIETNL